MAVYHPHKVSCACGNQLTVALADSINVKRFPETRFSILRGELHRAKCEACGRQMTVEKSFYYADIDRDTLIKVCPRGERYTWKEASKRLEVASSYMPATIMNTAGRTLRVVFGMDELREKLVAQDAGLDDRMLELLKVLLVNEHPILLRRARLRLSLESVTEERLEFRAAYEHDQKRFQLQMPCALAFQLASEASPLKAWNQQAHKINLFELTDHSDYWVNLWRWSPQPAALERLRSYALEVKAGQQLETQSEAFQQMLDGLPRGSHLSAWAKLDLQTLFDYAKKLNLQQLEDQLFEIRFGIKLEDDWATNTNLQDIDTLWKLLKALPPTHVEGNTEIREILLNLGEGGGSYDPTTHDISIGSHTLRNQESFEDVVRHEVGHAVHEMKKPLINQWLGGQFGWQVFGTAEPEINEWVGLMGGWGDISDLQRQEVTDALRQALSNGKSWYPGSTPSFPPDHPWHRADFGPRLALEKTGAHWYLNFLTWHRANGKAFFLNYWYKALMVVDTTTLDLVSLMPKSYAAMSHFEFFAELYALYYDMDDPLREVIPADVIAWLDQNLDALAKAGLSATASDKREWETITRPKPE